MQPPDHPAPGGALPSEPAPASEPSTDLGFLFAQIVDTLPEFVPRYLQLMAPDDDDPSEPMVLMDLATFVADSLAAVVGGKEALGTVLGLIEALAIGAKGDDARADLLSYAFFDCFTIEDRRMLAPLLGPHSRQLLDSLDTAADAEWP